MILSIRSFKKLISNNTTAILPSSAINGMNQNEMFLFGTAHDYGIGSIKQYFGVWKKFF